MKTKTLTTILALVVTPFAFAEKEHDHDHDPAHKHGDDHKHEENVNQGPNKGHVIQSKGGFIIEVTVDKERKARILFLDKDMKPVALEAQTINGIAGERSAPTKLAFAKGADKDANVLISDVALPDGAHVPIILTVKTTPDGKAVTERFEMHLH